MKRLKAFIDWLIRGEDGKAAIIQWPNLPLITWFICSVLAHFTDGSIKTGFSTLSTGFIVAWCYLEISGGASPFRRILGGAVMIFVGRSLFSTH